MKKRVKSIYKPFLLIPLGALYFLTLHFIIHFIN
jgi:hypothetical protein